MNTTGAITEVIQVDFRRASRGKLQSVAPGVYQFQNKPGKFYCRPVLDGAQKIYALKSIKLKEARIEWGDLRSQLAKYHAGLAKNPFITSDGKTVAEICRFYLERGLPGKNPNKIRKGKALKEETFRVNRLLAWSGSRLPADEMSAEKWSSYHDWRIKNPLRKGKGGDRAVDKERATLSNIFRCALQHQSKTGIEANPMQHGVQRFRDAAKVEHCRDFMPRSGDELHMICSAMLQTRRSEVLAWQYLLEALIGPRSAHIIHLRWDAKDKQPGSIAGNKLYLYRSTSSKGTYGHIDIHGPLEQLLTAMKAWHQKRYPAAWRCSPNAIPEEEEDAFKRFPRWFLPSPKDPTKPVCSSSLTHRLPEITKLLKLPKRTSQGARSYYVNVRRSQGWSDEKISLHVGHITKGKLIVEVYGEGLDYRLDWLPKQVQPAWAPWHPDAGIPSPIQLDLL